MMQLVLAVFMIRVIIELIRNRIKDRKISEQVKDEQVDASGSAELQIR